MTQSNFNNFVCVEGCVSSTIDIIVYGTALCYFIGRAGKDKFGIGTVLMLLVPMVQYSACMIGRVDDFINRDTAYCSIYMFKHWWDWI
jgi:hypothetical protein